MNYTPVKSKKIYVTVGWKNSNIPMANKVALHLYEDEDVTEVQLAKKLRKQYAECPQMGHYSIDTKPFNPSDLYWAIFDGLYDSHPRICSDNFRDGEVIVNSPSVISNMEVEYDENS